MLEGMLFFVHGIFFISFVAFVLGWSRSSKAWSRAAEYFLNIGFLTLCVILYLEAMEVGVYLPVANQHQAIIFFVWAVLLMFLFVGRGSVQSSFGLILVPLVLCMLVLAMTTDRHTVKIAEEYVSDQLFALHTVTAFLAYASFALSFVGSALYLLQNRALKRKEAGRFYRQLPPLDELEHMVYVTVVLGIPLMTVTLVTGFMWSKNAFGHYWIWEPKVIFATFTWLLYVLVLYVRYIRSFRGTRLMIYTFASFSFVMVTFLGSNIFQQQIHRAF